MVRASEIEAKPPPSCPECGEPMKYYGGTAGWIHCGYKLLYRAGGWFRDDPGRYKNHHVQDERLSTGRRSVTHIKKRA